jgi:hypothetical protein
MNWARDKSLFDLAMNRMETLVYKVPPECILSHAFICNRFAGPP